MIFKVVPSWCNSFSVARLSGVWIVSSSLGMVVSMGLFLDLQNKFKNSLWLIVVFLVFIYFSFYTVNGERGLLRYMYLSKEIKYARQVAEQYNAEKRELEQKVRLLSSNSLDLDLLEERARIVLNFAADDEFVILDSYEK